MTSHNETPQPAPRDLDPRERDLLEVSGLLDGEHDPHLLLEIIDRIADDREVRDFYRNSRALGGLVAASEPNPAVEPPAHLWREIAGRAGLPVGRQPSRPLRSLAGRATRTGDSPGSRPSTAATWGRRLALAAGLLTLALTAGWFVQRGEHAPRLLDLSLDPRATSSEGGADTEGGDDATLTIDIGESGGMTERRFVELASELLHADRRYRREMARLIDTVESDLRGRETSADYDIDEGVDNEEAYDELGGSSAARPSIQLR